jgi:hypothetical protein
VSLLPEQDFIFRNIPNLTYLASIEPAGPCSIDGKALARQTFTISAKSATVRLEYHTNTSSNKVLSNASFYDIPLDVQHSDRIQ